LLEVKKYYPCVEFKEVNHDKDHVYMLVSIPPTIGVGEMGSKTKFGQSHIVNKATIL
jgi:REP element-mobilizing transposase RayT